MAPERHEIKFKSGLGAKYYISLYTVRFCLCLSNVQSTHIKAKEASYWGYLAQGMPYIYIFLSLSLPCVFNKRLCSTFVICLRNHSME